MSAPRADRCAACGRPTYVGEDFNGPCVYDTDLACALAQRDEARAERDRLIGHGCDGDTVNACDLLDLYHERMIAAEKRRDDERTRRAGVSRD